MAKGKSKGGRDNSSPIANGTLSRPTVTPSSVHLIEVQDRRTYHPEAAARPPLSTSGTRTRLKAVSPLPKPKTQKAYRAPVLRTVPHQIGFRAPESVLVCVRRKIRKEVLHALRKTGFGKRHRRPRRTRHSNIRC